METIKTVKETIVKNGMISQGDTVIAGLSGGADSVCLLLCLEALSLELGFSLRAVHVNHCLRGKESDGDEDFCVRLCSEKGIPIEVFRVDVNAYSAEKGMSTEAAARELRYDAFSKASKGHVNVKIATAHNKWDNTETMLFNFTRGTGMKGMCGIPYTRDNIIRPLLDAPRDEIEKFLEEMQQSYVTDSTNLTDDYSRNKLRHNVLPVLCGINRSVHDAASRLAQSAREDESFFESFLSEIPSDEICRYPVAVRKRYIKKLFAENGFECSFERLCSLDEMMRSGKNTRYNISNDIYAVFRNGCMTIERSAAVCKKDFEQQISFGRSCEINIGIYDKIMKISGYDDENFSSDVHVNIKLTNSCLNCAKIQGVAVLRNKHDGDSIILRGRDFSTKLKKLYNSMKLPAEERMSALVIEDEEGIIWSEYGGVSQRVAAVQGDNIRDIYKIKVYGRSRND